MSAPLLKAGDWLNFLHRGGNVAHFWCASPAPTSTWFDNTPRARFAAWEEAKAVNAEQYVSINPSTRIPPSNKSGNTNPKNIAKQIEYIQCINVLHCEYDGKDWVREEDYTAYLPEDWNDKEYPIPTDIRPVKIKQAQAAAFYADPASYKAMALAHIADLPYRPTLIVDSGGGYHCYWYLKDTVYIEDSNRQSVIDTQHWWVLMNGGDQGVSDITRVYRVLGTKNMKPGWAGNNPTVTAIEYDEHRLYDYRILAEAAGEWRQATQAATTYTPSPIYTNGNAAQSGKVRDLFNSSVDLIALLESRQYRVKYRAGQIARLVRPGGETPSVTVLPTDGQRPAIVVAHNTGDPLYRDGKGHDAYSAAQTLNHNGDWKAAYMEAKKAVGMWEETPNPKAQKPTDDRRQPAKAEAKPAAKPKEEPKKEQPPAPPVTKKDEWMAALASLGHTFALNRLEDTVEIDGRMLDDVTRSEIYLDMISRGVGKTYVDDVLNVAAKDNAYHPVQKYLTGLVWNGEDHLAAFLDHLTGDSETVTYANGTSQPLWRLLFSRWLLGCVARALDGDKENPFKHQTPVLVFVGGQDIGKSSIPRWLVSGLSIQYHQEGPLDPHRIEDKRSMVTKWIWEVSELGSSLRRTDLDALKSFVTQEWHTYRKPWGKGNITKPTLCNLVGTINPNGVGFLDDSTGNRRFLPIKITRINHDYKTAVNVDQLWAQLVHLYRNGVSPNLSPEEKVALKDTQAEHEIEKPLQTYLQMYFDIIPGNDDMKCFTADIIARLRSFNVALNASVTVAGKEITEALTVFGLDRKQTSIGGVKGRAWFGIAPNMKIPER